MIFPIHCELSKEAEIAEVAADRFERLRRWTFLLVYNGFDINDSSIWPPPCSAHFHHRRHPSAVSRGLGLGNPHPVARYFVCCAGAVTVL